MASAACSPALGGRLVPGFDVVAAHVGLDHAIAGAGLVVTGEGCLDDSSYEGKVVGGVLARAARHGVPVLVVAGRIDTAPPAGRTHLRVVSLVDEVGEQRAMTDGAGRGGRGRRRSTRAQAGGAGRLTPADRSLRPRRG